MKDILASIKKIIPKRGELSTAVSSFSKKELYIFLSLFAVLAASTLIIISKVNRSFTEKVPAQGGSITEGIIGIPRFINPVLAISDADKDLSALVYSGLMRKTTEGELAPDLAASYEVSKDGLTYTFELRSNATFHDKKSVTVDDVIYTISQIQDPMIKSPKRVSWEGVTALKIDETHLAFKLKAPYAPFLENTTVGILPSHIWKNVSAEEFAFSDFNINAIGSGPYQIRSIEKSSSGVPRSYDLAPWKRLAPDTFVSSVTIRFYANERELIGGLKSGAVDNISGISPDNAADLADEDYRIETTVLPRMFGLFFNQNQAPIFLNKAVTSALSMSVNRERIIDEVLHGYGVAIDSPVPAYLSDEDESVAPFNPGQIDAAKAILAKDGWVVGTDGVLAKKSKTGATTRLAFSISTGDTPELKQASELIKQDFEAIGAEVELKVFDTGNLNQSVIRPRKYDALFFGQVISHESDLFAFWHSSQRNDPGLNIAMYANAKVDKLLDSSLATQSKESRTELYQSFETEFTKDKPAIFVYSPEFIYVVTDKLQGLAINEITTPTERFDGITGWYIETERLWKIFTN